MNWTLTPEQQRLLSFLELDPESPKVGRPRLSDIELKQFIARRFRELGRPPTIRELDPHRGVIKTRFGGHANVLRIAADQILTDEERAELYVWRCQYCPRTFRNANGRAKHERACKKRGEIT